MGKNKEDITRVKEAKVMFHNKKQLLCSNNPSLEREEKLKNSRILGAALCGLEIWTLGKNEKRVVNAFETWRWRRTLKIKWADRITNDEVFQRVKDHFLKS